MKTLEMASNEAGARSGSLRPGMRPQVPVIMPFGRKGGGDILTDMFQAQPLADLCCVDMSIVDAHLVKHMFDLMRDAGGMIEHIPPLK